MDEVGPKEIHLRRLGLEMQMSIQLLHQGEKYVGSSLVFSEMRWCFENKEESSPPLLSSATLNHIGDFALKSPQIYHGVLMLLVRSLSK